MIEAIIFDLGGVLFTNGTTLFAKYIADKHNKDQHEVYALLNYSESGNAYREGKITWDEFYDAFKKELAIEDDANKLQQKWIDVYEIIDETRKILEELRKKYKVYFLSDNVKERVIAADQKYGFMQWFQGGVFSYEEGVRKPHDRIYEITIKKVGLPPEKMLFIDDKKRNLLPAARIGMHTLLYKNPEQLKEELKKMKLL